MTPDAPAGRGSADGAGGPDPQERRALFRVVRGAPTDAELAALTVVLVAAAARAATPRSAPDRGTRSVWNDPAARLRRPLPVGPGAWRTSAWPR